MLSHKFRKPVFVGVGMFLVLLALTQLLVYFWYQSARYAEIRRLTTHANAKKERLHITLTNSLSSTRTLAFIVEEYGVPRDFDRLGEKLLKANPLVDAIELVQGGVITHIFPIEGNESAIGYNILSDTISHSGALVAMRTKDFFFAGPVKLKQGGVAVIGRQPIYIEGKFWGFAAVLIRLSNFIEATNIDAGSNPDFRYQLARVHRETGSEEFFLPSGDIQKGDDVAMIEVPNSEWRLYVTPLKQNEVYNHARLLAGLGLLFSAVVSAFSWYMAAQPEKLKRLVNERTGQLTTEKELSDSIINSLPGLFYLYDENLKFYRWNKNLETVSGYSAKEISDMHPLDFIESNEKELMREGIATVFDQGSTAVEAHLYTKNKEKISYYFTGNATTFGGRTYLMGMGIDITERVKAEKDIQDLNVRLQATVEQLQARNNDLQLFSYVVSHNLRSPIARILGLASIFQHEANDQAMIVEKITEATQQLDDIIKDISTIISARNINEKYEHVLFDNALTGILKLLNDEIQRSNAEVLADFSAAPDIFTVKSYLNSMLYNLLSNAIKYRKPNIPLQISIKTTIYEHGVCLTVQDNGIGIDLVKNGGKIFGLYKRFGPESIPGKGIGLCLVKNQVESLNGKIEVNSKPGEGSTFYIYLQKEHERSERK
ncbi:ATP-binding protein [Ohtaekwangia sp.]|uniref:ATP-binding protein n=1 Tax=Ohtaekwangia sp. TaxID=2066019 RepID=UPI002FDE3A20